MAVRVLMLGWEYPPRINGGLGVACRGLVEALSGLAEVKLVLPGKVSVGKEGAEIERIGAYGLGGALYGAGMDSKVSSYAKGICGRAADLGFDVIHAHDWMTLVAGMELKELSGKPLVAHVHSLEFDRGGTGDRGWVYEVEKSGMEVADVVVAVSGYTAGVCWREYGIDRGKVAVVHNGVERIAPSGGQRESLVVYVGRLVWQKGAEMFVQMAIEVGRRFPEVRFAMAGEGELRCALERQIEAGGLAEKVDMLGFLERDEVFDLLRRAKVFCMPSVSEPFGIAALEAATCGVPVVVSRQSGVREVLGSARLVDAWDGAGWVEQVARLLEDEGERGRLADAVRGEASRCTWDGAAAKVLGVYRGWLGLE